MCKKCFNDTCIAYALKTKCLDTDRTLKAFERKLNEKLNDLESFRLQTVEPEEHDTEPEEPKQEYIELEMESDEEIICKQEEVVVFEEDGNDVYSMEVYENDTRESFEIVNEMYEEIEYLETDLPDPQFRIEEFEVGKSTVPIRNAKKYCIYCKTRPQFKTEIGLNRHKFEVHQVGEDNPLICPTCSFTFDGDLKEEQLSRIILKHAVAHEKGKNHSCMFCPEVFKSLRHLEEHQLRHINNTQPGNRCKGCFSEFPSVDELQAHLWTSNCKENHERPFRCYICQETFSMGIAKKKHIQVDHQDKAGADCPLCLRCKIPSAVAFENHYKTHFAGEFDGKLELSDEIIPNNHNFLSSRASILLQLLRPTILRVRSSANSHPTCSRDTETSVLLVQQNLPRQVGNRSTHSWCSLQSEKSSVSHVFEGEFRKSFVV
jgi:hypothetical protein